MDWKAGAYGRSFEVGCPGFGPFGLSSGSFALPPAAMKTERDLLVFGIERPFFLCFVSVLEHHVFELAVIDLNVKRKQASLKKTLRFGDPKAASL